MTGEAVAALFVERTGVYASIAGVDPWGIDRDARTYRGPHPVVAHPPCERWGRYWSGGPSARVRRHKGDDAGCFAAALWAVRTFGGVLEHPEGSHAWGWFGLPRPRLGAWWSRLDEFGGRSVCVDQGAYGHAARKRTWLYAAGIRFESFQEFRLCSEPKQRLEPGFHSAEEARAARGRADWRPVKRLTREQRIGTPTEFAALLLEMARTAMEDSGAERDAAVAAALASLEDLRKAVREYRAAGHRKPETYDARRNLFAALDATTEGAGKVLARCSMHGSAWVAKSGGGCVECMATAEAKEIERVRAEEREGVLADGGDDD